MTAFKSNHKMTRSNLPCSSPAEWSRLELILLPAVVFCSLALRLQIATLPVEYLANMHLFQYKAGTVILEDSFYTLNIARNFAAGLGLTHDGVHQTTGVQPLAMLIASIGYALFPGDPDLPIHISLVFLSLVSTASMILMYLMCRRMAGPWAGMFGILLWMGSPSAIVQINCLETSLSVLLNMSLLYYYFSFISRKTPTGSNAFVFGIIAGLAVFARLDALLLVFVIYIHWIWTLLVDKMRIGKWLELLPLSVVGMMLAYSPWLILCIHHVGRIGYDSGIARRQLSLLLAGENPGAFPSIRFYCDNIIEMVRAFVEMHPIIFPWLTLPGTAVSAGGLLLLLLLSLVIRKKKPHPVVEFQPLWIITAYSLFFMLAYIVYQFGRDFYHRYLATVIFLSLIPLSILVFSIMKALRQISRPVFFLACILLALSLSYSFVPTFYFLNRWEERYDYYQSGYYRFSGMARWLRDNTEPDALIGSFQSGQLSYYSGRTVINLDGIVNRDAYEAIRNRRMASYVRSLRLDYLTDWDIMIEKLLNNASDEPPADWELEKVYTGYFKVYRMVHGNLRP